jgi:Domain of unknown function (DUF1814).
MADELSAVEPFLPPGTAAAWRVLAPVVPDIAFLAGGTAITVHLKHRISRDLAFFMEALFDVDELIERVESVGQFAPTMVDDGTVNGIFEGTKVQFLDASTQFPLQAPTEFAGIRLASLPDLMAMKLKVIQDRGELRDYFDIMLIEQHGGISVDAGLKMLVDRYRPRAPEGVVAGVVRGLGYMGDVENDPSLPVSRQTIEKYWQNRQPELLRHL